MLLNANGLSKHHPDTVQFKIPIWFHTLLDNNPSSTLVTSRVTSELKMAERRRTWSDREIAVSLAKWSDKTIQRQLCGAVCVVPFRAIANKLKYGFHSISLQPVTAQGKYVWFLCLTQTVLHCMRAVAMWCSRKVDQLLAAIVIQITVMKVHRIWQLFLFIKTLW